jgi:hypothetical protein
MKSVPSRAINNSPPLWFANGWSWNNSSRCCGAGDVAVHRVLDDV